MDDKLREAIELLGDSKAKKRESGAKRLRKLASSEAGSHLLDALKKEMTDKRTWSSQYHMILALGFCKYDTALPFLLDLAKEKFDAKILYFALGDAIFRLSITSESIKESLNRISEFNNFGIYYGAFQALSMLQLIPDDDDIKKIIEIARDPRGVEVVKGHPNDKTGLRKWVATASSGWKDELKTDFLSECSLIEDAHLKMAVESSRVGKYEKWNPY